MDEIVRIKIIFDVSLTEDKQYRIRARDYGAMPVVVYSYDMEMGKELALKSLNAYNRKYNFKSNTLEDLEFLDNGQKVDSYK